MCAFKIMGRQMVARVLLCTSTTIIMHFQVKKAAMTLNLSFADVRIRFIQMWLLRPLLSKAQMQQMLMH
jgi:hypothetical protein